jgi:multimeric flavodoxin WrbA
MEEVILLKILGIVGSARKGGNTEIMVREALDAARQAGAETELFLVADKSIAGCDGCEVCYKSGICKIKDDMVPIYELLKEADGIIFGTPVYYGDFSSQAKAVIDRAHALRFGAGLKGNSHLAGKVAGGIIVTRRVGGGQVRGLLYNIFLAHDMIPVRAAIGYGRAKGDIKEGVGGLQGLTALQEARELGERVVKMVKRLS